MVSRRAKTVAGVWQWMEPWSVVSSTGTLRRSASRRASQSGDRSNQVRVRFRSACVSRATSKRVEFSVRPCVSWSMKLKTSAVTPSCARWAGSRRSSPSPSAAVNTFS